jgi:hypothetical protein
VGKVKKKPKSKGGRPSLLTLELTQQICSYIVAGGYDYAAAEACDISHGTFMEWMRRGEDTDRARGTDEKFAKFAKAVRHAKARARISAEVTVKKADPKWWLARMYRDKRGVPGWSDSPTQLEVTGKESAPLGLTLEMVRQFLEATEEKEET